MKKFLVLVMAMLLICGCMFVANADTISGEAEHDFGGLKNSQATPLEGQAPTCTSTGIGTLHCNRCNKDIQVTMPKLPHTEKAGTTTEYVYLDNNKDGVYNCGDDLYMEYGECAVCHNKYQVYIDTLQHSFDSDMTNPKNYKVTAATCTTKAYTTYFCMNDNCNEEYVVYGEALGHTWQIIDTEKNTGVVGKAPTCKDTGKAGVYAMCETCHDVYDGTVLWLLNKKEVAANTEGATKYEINGVEIPKLSHEVTTEWGKAFLEYYFYYEDGEFVWPGMGVNTDIEGERVQNPFVYADYTYTDVSGNVWEFDAKSCPVTVDWKAPTCKEDGYLTVKCACGEFDLTEEIKAEGHFYTDARIEYVDVNGDNQDVNVPLTHLIAYLKEIGIEVGNEGDRITAGDVADAVEWLIDYRFSIEELQKIIYKFEQKNQYPQMDCTIQPIVHFFCGCGHVVKGLTAAASAHEFGTTETSMSYREFCELVDNSVILLEDNYGSADDDNGYRWLRYPVAVRLLQAYRYGHEGNDGYGPSTPVSKKLYWEKDGDECILPCLDFTAVVRCANCAVTTKINVKGEGHDKDEWEDWCDENNIVTFREASCTKTGVACIVCHYYCGYETTVTIPMEPHTKDDTKTTVKSADCVNNGLRTFVCKDCSYGANGEWTEVIPSYGHNYQWTITSIPGCKKAGQEDLKCTRCGDVSDTRKLPEGHVVADMNSIAKVNVAEIATAEIEAGTVITKITWKDCTKPGTVQFFCINCNLVTIVNEPAAAHVTTNVGLPTTTGYKYVDDETCSITYSQAKRCVNCTTAIPAATDTQHTKHDPIDSRVLSGEGASCTEAGKIWYLCGKCGDWYEDVEPAGTHYFRAEYNTTKKVWEYVCQICGEAQEFTADAENYGIDMSGAVMGNRPTGKGQLTTEDDLSMFDFVFGDRYAYIYAVYKNKAGEDVVMTKVEKIADDGTFSVKGFSVAASMKLDYYMIIVTDNADADELRLNQVVSYGDIYKKVN